MRRRVRMRRVETSARNEEVTMGAGEKELRFPSGGWNHVERHPRAPEERDSGMMLMVHGIVLARTGWWLFGGTAAAVGTSGTGALMFDWRALRLEELT